MASDPPKPPVARTHLGVRLAYYRDFADASTIGIQFVLSIAAGFAIGRWVDAGWFQAKGIATMIGAVLGVAAAFYSLWGSARRAQKKMEEYARAREQALLGEANPASKNAKPNDK